MQHDPFEEKTYPTPTASRPLDLVLSYGPLGLIRARARQIRDNGLSVDTGRIALPHHSEVEITFSLRQECKVHVHRIAARVSGSAQGLTHLTFVNGVANSPAFLALKSVVDAR